LNQEEYMLDSNTVVDRYEILELLTKFHRGVDAHNWPMLKESVLTKDATWESYATDGAVEMEDVVHGTDEFLEWLAHATEGSWARHLTTNHLVDVQGDTGTSESFMYVIDPVTLATLASGVVTAQYVRAADGWRIQQLRIEEQVPLGVVELMAGNLKLETRKVSS
jgi:hypothetical protein